MYSAEALRKEINYYHTEIEFDYAGAHYFISDNNSKERGAEPHILICGPQNDEYVWNVDEVLDKLIVDGKPLREVIHMIDPL